MNLDQENNSQDTLEEDPSTIGTVAVDTVEVSGVDLWYGNIRAKHIFPEQLLADLLMEINSVCAYGLKINYDPQKRQNQSILEYLESKDEFSEYAQEQLQASFKHLDTLIEGIAYQYIGGNTHEFILLSGDITSLITGMHESVFKNGVYLHLGEFPEFALGLYTEAVLTVETKEN